MAINLFNDFQISVNDTATLREIVIESLWEDVSNTTAWKPVADFVVDIIDAISSEFPEARKYARKALKAND